LEVEAGKVRRNKHQPNPYYLPSTQ
jgi:hypothetical protein